MTHVIVMRWWLIVAVLALAGCGLFGRGAPQLVSTSPQVVSFEVVNGNRAATDRKADLACGNYGQHAQFREIKPSDSRQIAYYDCK